MENVSRVAIELGYLDIPAESLIDIDDICYDMFFEDDDEYDVFEEEE